MKFKFLVFTFFTFLMGFAQQTATITGTVTDKDMNSETLPFATVIVQGTQISTLTDENGKYTLTVPAGSHTILYTFMGYIDVAVPVTVAAGETITINQELKSDSVKLEDVVIEKLVSRERESALLMEQQKAVEMRQAIGAQEMIRKGVTDAAGAVIKTVGVTKQEGVNNVFVRGLGDRYNSTTLNGLPLPSEDPVYKNISLEFFNSNIIRNININKTFSANLYSDVAGANINIASKELEKGGAFSVSASTGYNTNAIKANFLIADGAYSYFGFLQNGTDVPISDLNSYDFDTSFKPNVKSNPINTNFNIIGGRRFELGENESISFFGVVMNYSDFQYKEGIVRQLTSAGNARQDMDFQRSEYKVTQAALVNAKYKTGSFGLAWNSLYIHDNSQSVGDYNGFSVNINEEDAPNSMIRRQQMNNNNLFVNQLLADYKFSDKLSTNVSAAYNMIRGSEPDRRTNSYDYDYAGSLGQIVGRYPGLNNRYFSTLEENDVVAKAEVAYTFNPESNLQKTLTVGGNYRNTERTFNYLQVNYDFGNITPIDVNNPEGVFNQANLDLGKNNGGFDLETLGGRALDNPYYYIGNRDIAAGYAQVLLPFNEKLTVVAGARFETFKQTIDWDTYQSSSVTDLTIFPSNIEKSYVLPSFSIKYSLNDKNALRFAASETYTMPQFKEAAAFLYEDINFSEVGNPDLVPSTDYNFDLKYDWYLSGKEIISIGAFYKYIQDPISRVRVSSASNDLSYVNTASAMATGVELEVRKTLHRVEGETRNRELSFGFNTSYLYSVQKQDDVNTDKLTPSFTHDRGRLQGASPLLINSDLSYYTDNGNTALTSTVVFNYFHDKVYSLGTVGLENIVEKTVPTLDFINRFQFKETNLTINFGVKNILNPEFRFTQETTTLSGETTESIVSSYRKGLTINFGLNWTL